MCLLQIIAISYKRIDPANEFDKERKVLIVFDFDCEELILSASINKKEQLIHNELGCSSKYRLGADSY